MTIDFNLTEDDIKEAVRRYVHQLAAPITIEGNIIVTLTHQQERQAGATYSALASVCAGRRGPAALSFARRSPTEQLDIVLHNAELLHIKVVDGDPVPSGPPSCWQCSRLILDCGISKVWLVHADGLKSYTADEFHEATLRECGLPVIREAAHG